jgi:hypothetical protein
MEEYNTVGSRKQKEELHSNVKVGTLKISTACG